MSEGESNVPTRERLLELVDDMELVSKRFEKVMRILRDLIENVFTAKPKRLSPKDQDELTLLLISKNNELKETLKLAAEQADIEKRIQELENEVKREDDCIKQLQKQFRDAENVLSTAVYQAKQKLESINKAKQTPVNSEDLIRYAHRISASNAVCAPLNWEQGDPRRPYPTDLEMRLGFLGRGDAMTEVTTRGSAQTRMQGSGPQPGSGTPSSNDFHMVRAPSSPHIGGPLQPQRGPIAGPLHPPAGASPSRMVHHQGPHQMGTHAQGGLFSWHGGEMSMTFKDGSSIPIETTGGHSGRGTAGGHNHDEVDVMSTDSSSSSSTDSN